MDGKAVTITSNKLWTQVRTRPLAWDTITTTTLSSIGKGVGFLIPFFIAAWFGVSAQTDAFFFTYGLILFLSGIFAPVVERVIVPYVTEARANGEDVGRFVGDILGISGIGLLIPSSLFVLLIKPVLSAITRFDTQSLNLVFRLSLETAPLIILLTWTSVLAGTLNAYKKFAFPALSPAFRAIINLAIIFILKDTWGVHAIAWGYVVGEFFRLLILLGTIYKLNLFFLPLSVRFNPKIREFLKAASYQIIAMIARGLNRAIDVIMASWLGTGNISILHYADRLYMIPVIFMTSGVMVTLLSHWSDRSYRLGPEELKKDVRKTLRVVTTLVLIITVILILFHRPIVKLAFGRGGLALEKLEAIGWVWVCYLFGLVPHILTQLYIQAHISLKNTRIFVYWGFLQTILKITLNFILMMQFDVAGIALATAGMWMFSSLYFSSLLRKLLETRIEKGIRSRHS